MDSSGNVDEDGLRRLIDFAIDAGATGLLCTALAGEVSQLSPNERRHVVEVVIDGARGRLPVIVGLGNELDESPRLGRFARERGAAAVMLSAPVGISQPLVVEWMTRTALDLETRVVVQEAPGYLGNAIGPDGLREIVETCDNVQDIKVEGGPHALSIVGASIEGAATLWGGDGGVHALDCLRAGAVGFMPGVEVVDLLVTAYRAESAGDPRAAEAILGMVLPLVVFEMQSLATYVASAKRGLVLRGLLSSAASRLAPQGLPVRLERLLLAHLRVALGDAHAS